MLKNLLKTGIILAGFVSFPGWAILINDGGAFDGTDVGVLDTFIAEGDKQAMIKNSEGEMQKRGMLANEK